MHQNRDLVVLYFDSISLEDENCNTIIRRTKMNSGIDVRPLLELTRVTVYILYILEVNIYIDYVFRKYII